MFQGAGGGSAATRRCNLVFAPISPKYIRSTTAKAVVTMRNTTADPKRRERSSVSGNMARAQRRLAGNSAAPKKFFFQPNRHIRPFVRSQPRLSRGCGATSRPGRGQAREPDKSGCDYGRGTPLVEKPMTSVPEEPLAPAADGSSAPAAPKAVDTSGGANRTGEPFSGSGVNNAVENTM